MTPRPTNGLLRALLAAAVLGVAARLVFSLGYWNEKPLTRDEHEYLSLARSLAAGHGFVYDSILKEGPIEPFGRAPGYPAFLALVGGGREPVSAVPVAVDLAQAAVGGLGVLVIGLLANTIAGASTAIWAARLAAVYPPLVWIAGYALSEAIFWPIALFGTWLVEVARRSRAPAAWALAGGTAIGAAILVRPGHALFVPLVLLTILGGKAMFDRASRHQSLVAGASLLVGVMLIVGPWTVRNYVHHGRFVFVASDGGVTFWTGNHPLAIGEGDMAANPALKIDNLRLRAANPGLSEEDLEPIFYREAFAWIRSHPLDWLVLELRKLFYVAVPIGPSYTLHSPRYFVLSVVSYCLLLVLAISGLARDQRLKHATGLWALGGSAVITSLVFFPQERFRIPIIDPILVIFAGAALASWSRRVARP